MYNTLIRAPIVLVLVTLVAAGAATWTGPAHAAGRTVPARFAALTYTEGLGRAPDPAEWERAMARLGVGDCTPERLARFGESVLDGPELAALPYDDGSRLLALSRAVLDRDPRPSEWRRWLRRVRGGTPWPEVVGELYASPEFRSRAATTLCHGAPGSDHGPDSGPLVREVSGAGVTTEAGLRAALRPGGSPAPPGAVVELAAEAAIPLSGSVDVPPGVTLETAGRPPRTAYAAMARLVRDRPDDQYGAVLILEPGATLANVWVDGRGGDPAENPASAASAGADVDVDVRAGATGGSVVASRLENVSAGGFTTLHLSPSDPAGPRCGSQRPALVEGDLVTGYSGEHGLSRWRDGISVGCESSRVVANEVVDATDTGIVVFRPVVGSQASVVEGNRILAAGSSAFAALAADPLNAAAAPPAGECAAEAFEGTWFRDNLVFTGPAVRFDLALTAGTRAFRFLDGWCTGVGARLSGNSTGGARLRTTEAVLVSGMHGATVTGNFDGDPVTLTGDNDVGDRCPRRRAVATVAEGTASGDLQPHDDIAVDGCEDYRSDADRPSDRDRAH